MGAAGWQGAQGQRERSIPVDTVPRLPVCTICQCPMVDSFGHRNWHAQIERRLEARSGRGER